MRDLPFFTTQNGVAALVLRQIPYTRCAYITLLDTQSPEKLLAECVEFARLAGAKQVFATGDGVPDTDPLYARIERMCAPITALPKTNARVIAVTEQTLENFRRLYNERMADVSAAAYLSQAEAGDLVKEHSAYFVYGEDVLLGILVAAGGQIRAVAGVRPGAGEALMGAAGKVLTEKTVYLEVATQNVRAMSLYTRLGFTQTGVVKSWYKIL